MKREISLLGQGPIDPASSRNKFFSFPLPLPSATKCYDRIPEARGRPRHFRNIPTRGRRVMPVVIKLSSNTLNVLEFVVKRPPCRS